MNIFKPTKRQLSYLASMFLVLGTATHASDVEPTGEALAGCRVVALVADGFHPGETPQPIAYWESLGAEVMIGGIETGTVKAGFGPLELEITHAVRNISIDEIDAVFIPGGTSPAKLQESEEILDFVRRAVAADKLVAAICHGPQVLIRAGVLEGRKATCVVVEEREYFDVRDALIEAGGTYVNEAVVQDGNIITSRLPGDVPAFKQAVGEALMAQPK